MNSTTASKIPDIPAIAIEDWLRRALNFRCIDGARLRVTSAALCLGFMVDAAAMPACEAQVVESSMKLTVVEYTDSFRTEVRSLRKVDNFLRKDAQGHYRLNLDPARDSKHRDIVEMLDHGIYIASHKFRNEIAEHLGQFPAYCQTHGSLVLGVEPIGHINLCVPGAEDNRRITRLSFTGCLQQKLDECYYDLDTDRGCNFEIGGLKTFLNGCSEALHKAIRDGAELMPAPANSPEKCADTNEPGAK